MDCRKMITNNRKRRRRRHQPDKVTYRCSTGAASERDQSSGRESLIMITSAQVAERLCIKSLENEQQEAHHHQQQQYDLNNRNSNSDVKQYQEEEEEEEMMIKMRKAMSRRICLSNRTTLLRLLVAALLCCCCLSRHVLISCQQRFNSEAPLVDVANFNAQPEGRADLSNLKPNTLDQLVGILSSLANQQNQQNRRPSLPINGQRLPQQQQQQQSQQTSTPISPFATGVNFQQANQRQRGGTNFNIANNNNNNNQLFQPSSPATPFLTLNRIPNIAQNQQQQQQQQQRQQPPAAFQNQQIQPINTIPLGSALNNNQNRLQQQQQQIPNNRLAPPIRLGPNSQNPFRPPPPQVAQPNQQVVRPSGGFAPSGPPPSQGSNGAMVVVQSPTSTSGAAPTQQVAPQLTEGSRTEPPVKITTTSSPNGSSETTSQEDRLPQPTDSSPTFSASPAAPAIQSEQPQLTSTTAGSSTTTELSSELVSASSWNPVDGNRSSTESPVRTRINLSPSPDIVTVPPGYNPDNPPAQNYDIAVSAQMGGSPNKQVVVNKIQQPMDSNVLIGSSSSSSSKTVEPQTSSSSSSISDRVEPTQTLSAAPTAITTIIWSPPVSELPMPTTSSSQVVAVQPSQRLSQETQQMRSSAVVAQQAAPSRIRDNSMLLNGNNNNINTNNGEEPVDPVVYGKPQARDSKPVAPPPALPGPTPVQASIETSLAGRPFIQPVQMDNQVRPYTAGAPPPTVGQQQVLTSKSNHGQQVPFRSSRPLGQQVPTQVGSAFTISGGANNQTMPSGDIQDYLANQPPGGFDNHLLNHEPTISAQGAQDPASFDLEGASSSSGKSQENSNNNNNSSSVLPDTSSSQQQVAASQQQPTQRLRRPTFKPKPAIPPIRIDSCIVGDDSSCDQSHNERCVTEYGISSCHCKPGFARLSQLRGYCAPVSSLQLNLKIDKLSDDRRLVFNQSLDNSNSEEYQYLEFETIQALAGAFQATTTLAKQFMGAKVNKFFERKGKVWANVSINFEANNMTKTDRIQTVASQELARVVAQQIKSQPHKTLGDSTIMLDGSKETISRLVDINECASKDLNDCSKHASCTNDFGGFHCQCLPGYEDKHLSTSEDRAKHGRVCLGCSASYCSNRGECSISEGQKHCKCRQNFIGARCDIDSEVLAVAVGGSLVGIVILLITFWCLFVFNRRWKREQQKMDAMSATSGLTFNYVNSSTNSLMSPSSRAMGGGQVGGLHRTGGHQVGAMAANYGQRFGAALVNGTRNVNPNHQHYAPDQQAIIGSTSSGSSASSQPIGCNPYAPGAYQYEDAGLLIAPASTGSSEQTSPTSNSYRGILGGGGHHNAAMMAGTAYTLSGHHHHHHHHPQLHHHHQVSNQNKSQQLSQFHPAAAATDYRTLNTNLHCPSNSNHYDTRWRTLQQESSNSKQQSALVGYYLSPDMLVNQQQLYASPRRELCIDTGAEGNNLNKSRKQKGRAQDGGFQSMRMRQQHQTQLNGPRGSMYLSNDYDSR